jgi:hypothetical protein
MSRPGTISRATAASWHSRRAANPSCHEGRRSREPEAQEPGNRFPLGDHAAGLTVSLAGAQGQRLDGPDLGREEQRLLDGGDPSANLPARGQRVGVPPHAVGM